MSVISDYSDNGGGDTNTFEYYAEDRACKDVVDYYDGAGEKKAVAYLLRIEISYAERVYNKSGYHKQGEISLPSKCADHK